jgi:DNA-binding CsgD family transcriptional regulator
MVADELEAAERWGVPDFIAAAERTLGLLDGGESGLARLARSVALLEESPCRLELASSLIEHGSALRRAGERRAARTQLTRGLRLAHEHGAWLLTERAKQELSASGERLRRLEVTGRDALTPAELRTARLAAEGRTNREIAQMLWISTKTVETHLGRIYLKLDIKSRRELPRALEPAAPAAQGHRESRGSGDARASAEIRNR